MSAAVACKGHCSPEEDLKAMTVITPYRHVSGDGVIDESGEGWAVSKVVEHLAPAVSKPADGSIATRGEGSYVYTSDGRKHLDMACGIGVLSTGHCHPKVVKAIQEQAGQLIMAQQNIFPASEPMVGLLQRFERIMPQHLTRFFFCNSGSEAVDNAIKVARSYTGRQNIIAFEGAFHGRTYGAMSLTTSKTVYRQGFGPLVAGSVTAPYPNCIHCKTRQAEGGMGYQVAPNVPPLGRPYAERQCCNSPLEALHWMFKMQTAPTDTAAIIIEPILGEGGFLTPPPGFLLTLRQLCDKHGILLIFDEVQAGMGRTGKWWAHQHLGAVEGAHPDIMLFAKGIASGFPFAGLATRADLYDNMAPGMMGGTYGGSALGCAAAAATIDAIEEDGMLQNAAERGMELARGLVELSKKYPITDVRGRGLMVAAEFGGNDGGLTPEAGVAAAVTKACGKRGMLLLTSGARETVRFLPPLNIKQREVQEALGIFQDALAEVFA
ncbi:hypothetical protein N2152v2_004596 [Parachlorella kessleri]